MTCAACIAQLAAHGQHDAARKLARFNDAAAPPDVENVKNFTQNLPEPAASTYHHPRSLIGRVLAENPNAFHGISTPYGQLLVLRDFEARDSAALAPTSAPAAAPKITAVTAAESPKMAPKPILSLLQLTQAAQRKNPRMSYDDAFTLALAEQSTLMSDRDRNKVITLSTHRTATATASAPSLFARAKAIQLRDACDWERAFTCALSEAGGPDAA